MKHSPTIPSQFKKTILFLVLISSYFGYAQNNACMLAHYKLDNNAIDSSVNANHGIIKGNPTVVTGFDGTPNGAYHFDGIDDYIVAVNNDVNFAVNDTFSISLWVKPDANQNSTSVTNNDILAKWEDYGSGNEGYPFSIRYYNQTSPSNGKMLAMRFDKNCSNFPRLNGSKPINDGVFHHIVFVKESVQIKIYVDGILEEAIDDLTSCETRNNDSLYIARRGYTYNRTFFAGVIDDIRIYGCSLTEEEVKYLFGEIPPVVEEEFEIYIPNTFTPNSDGTNDVWLVKVSGVDEIECYVFNRWGGLIYETKSLPIAWDGTYKGQTVANGVYTYIINLRDKNGKFHSYKGVIHVFR